MYLSQLILNLRSRQVRSELAHPYELHRTIMSAFRPMGERERVLYRLDISKRDGIPRLLVQSRYRPDWCALVDKETYLLALPCDNPGVRQYDPCPGMGQRLVFRLLASPTRSVKEGVEPGSRGKRKPIEKREDQIAWLERKAGLHGFCLHAVQITTLGKQDVKVPDRLEGRKKNAQEPFNVVQYLAVRYDGELEVMDPARFRQALESGIGSAKGFGYGLLSIAPR